MQGFTDKALILGPDPGLCDGRPPMWVGHFAKTVENILKYCKYNNIELMYLLTDEMIYKDNTLFAHNVPAIPTLGKGDMHFLATHNDSFTGWSWRDVDSMSSDIIRKYIEDVVRDKDNRSDDARITVMMKRESRAARDIIRGFNLIFNIQYKNNKQYKAGTKEGDCRAVVTIDAKTFVPTVEMSGQVISPIDVLGIGNANMPVYEWEVPYTL